MSTQIQQAGIDQHTETRAVFDPSDGSQQFMNFEQDKETRLFEIEQSLSLLMKALHDANEAVLDLRNLEMRAPCENSPGNSPGARLRYFLLTIKRLAHESRRNAQGMFY
jgi:hypothetical protein